MSLSFVLACQDPIVPTATPVAFNPTPAPERKAIIGGEDLPTPTPFLADSDVGSSLFVSKTCSGCHYVDNSDKLVGPSLLGIYKRAETRKDGYSAEEYIIESIRQPSVHIVEDYQNLMTAFSKSQISDSELQHLLAYLQTLE